MDPASIISLTAGLVTLCVRAGKGLHDVHTTWSGASMTVSAILSETTVIAAALQQIENVARHDPLGLSSRLDAGSGQLATSFELSLGGCELTLNILNEQISRLTASPKGPKFLSFRSKARYVWNETEMRELLQNIRGQQSALNLLLNAVQSESISDVRRILNDNNVILSKMVKQSQELKSVRAASTIGGKDIAFDFDDQIISSNAYRRAFNSFVNRQPHEFTGLDKKHDDDNSMLDSGVSSMTMGKDNFTTSDIVTGPVKDIISQTIKRKSIQVTQIPNKPLPNKPQAQMSELADDVRKLTTLLHTAVMKGHAALVENLIRKGARLDVSDDNGNLATHLAAKEGKCGILVVLLQKGVINIEAKRFDDNRALHLACLHGHLAVVKVLLDFGADILGRGTEGWSPLHHAAANDKVEVMQYLLERGASLDFKATEGDTPLHSAIAYGCYVATEMLIRVGSDIEAANYSQNRPLSVACKLARAKCVKLLVENGACIEGKGSDGWTPLHFAASTKSASLVQYLGCVGATIESLNDAGFTPLHIAAQYSSENTVQFLINSGSNVEASLDDGDRPLNIAASRGHCDIIRILINSGASVERTGSKGWYPIHEAAANGHANAVKFLVAKGASTEARTENGKTALQLASKFGETIHELFKLGANFEAKDDNGDGLIHYAAEGGHLETMQMLISHNASLNVANQFHFIPITLAGGQGHIPILDALLQAGVDINQQGAENGWTALLYTAGNNKSKALSFLLSKGANLEASAFNGDNALHVASCFGYVECVKLLLEAGINKDIIQSDGKTALDYAIDRGHETAMELLL